MNMPIPVTVLTGFLGSGKTTVLRHLLSSPAFADCAVLVNEFDLLHAIEIFLRRGTGREEKDGDGETGDHLLHTLSIPSLGRRHADAL